MEYRIAHAPTFSTLEVELVDGEAIVAQPSSMVVMSTGIEVTARVGGAMRGHGRSRVGRGLRSLVSGESFFAAVYRAKRGEQSISLAPDVIGDIVPIEVRDGQGVFLTNGSFLACDESVDLDTHYAGVKGWLAETGLFLMHATGTGRVFASSHGAVVGRTLGESERLVVDNAYVVAFGDRVVFDVVKAAASIRDSLLSGEGLATRYTGPGPIWYQTRRRPRASWVKGLLQAAT